MSVGKLQGEKEEKEFTAVCQGSIRQANLEISANENVVWISVERAGRSTAAHERWHGFKYIIAGQRVNAHHGKLGSVAVIIGVEQ